MAPRKPTTAVPFAGTQDELSSARAGAGGANELLKLNQSSPVYGNTGAPEFTGYANSPVDNRSNFSKNFGIGVPGLGRFGQMLTPGDQSGHIKKEVQGPPFQNARALGNYHGNPEAPGSVSGFLKYGGNRPPPPTRMTGPAGGYSAAEEARKLEQASRSTGAGPAGFGGGPAGKAAQAVGDKVGKEAMSLSGIPNQLRADFMKRLGTGVNSRPGEAGQANYEQLLANIMETMNANPTMGQSTKTSEVVPLMLQENKFGTGPETVGGLFGGGKGGVRRTEQKSPLDIISSLGDLATTMHAQGDLAGADAANQMSQMIQNETAANAGIQRGAMGATKPGANKDGPMDAYWGAVLRGEVPRNIEMESQYAAARYGAGDPTRMDEEGIEVSDPASIAARRKQRRELIDYNSR